MRKTLITALLVALAAFAGYGVVTANIAPQQNYTLRMVIAHDPAPPFYVRSMNHFAETVARETNGHVKVQVIDSKQYGTIDHRSIIDAVGSGAIEMSAATVSSLGSVERDFLVFEMPYMFDSYEQVTRAIDGRVGQALFDKLAPHGIRGLAYTFSGGYKVVAANAPIRKPADIAGMTVLARDPVNLATFEAMGARSVEGSLFATKQMMADGSVQASDMTFTRYDEYGLQTKYVNELEHSFFLTTMLVNEAYFQTLPQAYRDIIRSAARQAAVEERARTIQEIEAIRLRLAERGVQIVRLTPEQRDAFRTVTSSVYARLQGMFTAGLVDEIRSSRVASGPRVQ